MPGSSPRVQGTLRTNSRFISAPRFIPACAGNAPVCWVQICGSHKMLWTETLVNLGGLLGKVFRMLTTGRGAATELAG